MYVPLYQTHFKCQLKARQPSDTYSSDSHHIRLSLDYWWTVLRRLSGSHWGIRQSLSLGSQQRKISIRRVIELDFLIPLYSYAATRTSKLCIRCGHITSQGSDILKKLRNYNFQMRGNHQVTTLHILFSGIGST